MFVTVVVVHDRTNPINSTAVLLEPLWARSTHVVTFRMVTVERFGHGVLLWRSNCTENLSSRKYRVAINNTAGGYRRVTWVERLVEISREETAKRAKLFLPGEGQTLISGELF